MLFGLAGAHRSGKTSLAKKTAEDLGLHFHATSTTEVARSFGFDPVAPMSLEERVALQVALLHHHVKTLDKLPRPAIVDRTPADILAYTLAEIHMQSHRVLSAQSLETVEQMKDVAIKALQMHYSHVFVISQLPTFEVDPTKAPFNRAFQSHHALLVEGILSAAQEGLNYSLVRSTKWEERVDWLHDVIVKNLDLAEQRKRSIHYH